MEEYKVLSEWMPVIAKDGIVLPFLYFGWKISKDLERLTESVKTLEKDFFRREVEILDHEKRLTELEKQ